MKKPGQNESMWTKWFFPFKLYLPTLWRRRFPHHRPGPEQLRRYRFITNCLAAGFMLCMWSALGVAVHLYKDPDFGKDTNVYKEDGTVDEMASRYKHAAKYFDPNVGKIEIIKISASDGFSVEKVDATEEVTRIIEERERLKYDDIDYLANRANMKKDDPKFDRDFWKLYFKRVDAKREKTAQHKLEEFLDNFRPKDN